MKVYAFKSSVDHSLHGLTSDHTGNNLPLLFNNGQWFYCEGFDLMAEQPRIALDPGKALAEIATNGFCLAASEVSITEQRVGQ